MYKSLLLLTSIAVSASAVAANKKQDLQDHVTEQRAEIVTQEMRDEAKRVTKPRSELKALEDLAVRERSYYVSATENAKAKLQWEKEEFISKNVPISYIIAGDKAVTQYVIDNFINKANEKSQEAITLWSSNNTALVTLEQPVVAAPVVNKAVVEPRQSIEPKDEPTGFELSEDEQRKIAESLGALGLNLDQAGAIAEKKPEPVAEPSGNKNVLIQKIDIQRVVIMGKTTSLDANLLINVVDGFNKRDMSLPISNMSPGTRFMIDNTPFELTRLSEKEAIFTNVDTGVSFKEIVRQ